ncbi:MAG: nuclear transport factor 2 family protein [Terracidiphilus sp.]|jgi:hypothetical protein
MSDPPQPDQQVQKVREFLIEAYRDFNARRMEAVLARMQPDVDWPNGLEGGRVQGVEGVRVYWRRQWSLIDPILEPVKIDVDDTGKAKVRIHQIVRDLQGNLVRDCVVHHVYKFRDGLIDHMEIV